MEENRKNIFEATEWISNFLLGAISEEEEVRLRVWLAESSRHRELFDSLCDEVIDHKRLEVYDPELSERAFREFLRRRRQLESRYRFMSWVKYAAVLFLPLCIGSFLWWNWQSVENRETVTHIVEKSSVHLPVITLADGKEVVLQHIPLALTNHLGIKVAEGDSLGLVYSTPEKRADILEYHSLRTPSQCDYCFTLSDGTKVWVNAKTTVRYPVAFGKNERSIEVNGEVYLEVAKDTTRPFFVITNDVTVKVLGTSFNVNSYDDELHTVVTLTEGKIAAKIHKQEYALLPDHQLCFERSTGQTTIQEVDAEDFGTWRRGSYIFRGQTLEEVCRVLQRWYDVEIIFENPDYSRSVYTGIVYKEEKIEDFVSNLNHSSGYRCRIEKGRLYIR